MPRSADRKVGWNLSLTVPPCPDKYATPRDRTEWTSPEPQLHVRVRVTETLLVPPPALRDEQDVARSEHADSAGDAGGVWEPVVRHVRPVHHRPAVKRVPDRVRVHTGVRLVGRH